MAPNLRCMGSDSRGNDCDHYITFSTLLGLNDALFGEDRVTM